MKLLVHLIVTAVYVAALMTTTAASQAIDGSNSESESVEDMSKLLRGPEKNYDDAEHFPGPEESEDETELVDTSGDDSPQGLEDEDFEHYVLDDYASEYDRHVRSMVDPAPAGQIHLAELRPPKEKITPSPDRSLRGPEPGKL